MQSRNSSSSHSGCRWIRADPGLQLLQATGLSRIYDQLVDTSEHVHAADASLGDLNTEVRRLQDVAREKRRIAVAVSGLEAQQSAIRALQIDEKLARLAERKHDLAKRQADNAPAAQLKLAEEGRAASAADLAVVSKRGVDAAEKVAEEEVVLKDVRSEIAEQGKIAKQVSEALAEARVEAEYAAGKASEAEVRLEKQKAALTSFEAELTNRLASRTTGPATLSLRLLRDKHEAELQAAAEAEAAARNRRDAADKDAELLWQEYDVKNADRAARASEHAAADAELHEAEADTELAREQCHVLKQESLHRRKHYAEAVEKATRAAQLEALALSRRQTGDVGRAGGTAGASASASEAAQLPDRVDSESKRLLASAKSSYAAATADSCAGLRRNQVRYTAAGQQPEAVRSCLPFSSTNIALPPSAAFE